MAYYRYAFTGPLVIHRLGRYRYRAVFLPPALAAELPFDRHPRLRMTGEVADVPVEAAWQPAGAAAAGGYYLMVSAAVCRAAGLALGDAVEVRFNVADPAAVTVPDELAQALAGTGRAARAARAAWDALPPGKRRGLAAQVAAARTAPTRERRAARIAAALAAGEDPWPRPARTRTDARAGGGRPTARA
jgi:hypothetical protein